MKCTRASALLTGLAAVLALSACGVPTSGVIQAGDPATGIAPGLTVYFLADGVPFPVPRRTAANADVATAIRLVFAGLTEPEAASGKLTTALPPLKIAPEVKAYEGGIQIVLPYEPIALSRPAMEQLACTVFGMFGAMPALPAISADGRRTPVDTPTPTLAPGSVRMIVNGLGWRLAQDAVPCPAPR